MWGVLKGGTERWGGTEEQEVRGENNLLWSGRNSPVQLPAGSSTSHCVCMDVSVHVHVCVCFLQALSGACGGSFIPHCSLTAGNKMRRIYIWASTLNNKWMRGHTHKTKQTEQTDLRPWKIGKKKVSDRWKQGSINKSHDNLHSNNYFLNYCDVI